MIFLGLGRLARFAGYEPPRAMAVVGGNQIDDVKTFSYDSDVLQLGDPVSFRIANVDGQYNGKLNIGDSLEFYPRDPDVANGIPIRSLKGLVTKIERTSDFEGGTQMTVTGADLGWHLTNNSAPLWKNLRGITFDSLLEKLIDPSWGIVGVRDGNVGNRTIRQGRQAPEVQIVAGGTVHTVAQWIVVEPGEMVADLIMRYARRFRLLVNVSQDGYLQVWSPDYSQAPSYAFHHHALTDSDRRLNNVKKAKLIESIDGVFTDLTCVGTKVIPDQADNAGKGGPAGPVGPSFGHFRGDFHAEALPFVRRNIFTDSEPFGSDGALQRARWRYERGIFDSWTLEYEVTGHSQNGRFYVPDTMCEVHDSVHNVFGNYYISAVRLERDQEKNGGTRARITIKRPNLLAGGL